LLSELAAADPGAPDEVWDSDGPDEFTGADCSDEADESEPQAASRRTAKSTLAIRRTPIPFFIKIASFVLRPISDPSLKTDKCPDKHKSARAGAQAHLEPAHDLLPREAAALLLGQSAVRRASLSLLLDACPLCRFSFRCPLLRGARANRWRWRLDLCVT
jgi:hypothetical protein